MTGTCAIMSTSSSATTEVAKTLLLIFRKTDILYSTVSLKYLSYLLLLV